MMATTSEIVDRPYERPFPLADVRRNFRLRETGQLPAGKILKNPHITLYSLDFENRQAVFVETSADVNLSQAPFYFVTQYEKAKRVLTIPFETMYQLAQSVTLDDNRLVFIYSVGRCGSTLASQIFAQIPGVVNISEPDALTLLVIARNAKAHNEDDLVALLKATMCLLCKTPAETAWVIKGRSFDEVLCIHLTTLEGHAAHGDRHYDLAAHHLSFQVGVTVVPLAPLRTGLAGAAVTVAADRLVGGEFLQPILVIGVQAPLVVVDEHAACDMHAVCKAQSLADAAFAQAGINLGRDIDEPPLT